MTEPHAAYSAEEFVEFLKDLAVATEDLAKTERAGVLRALAAVLSGVTEYGMNPVFVRSYLGRSKANRIRFGDTVIERNLRKLEGQ